MRLRRWLSKLMLAFLLVLLVGSMTARNYSSISALVMSSNSQDVTTDAGKNAQGVASCTNDVELSRSDFVESDCQPLAAIVEPPRNSQNGLDTIQAEPLDAETPTPPVAFVPPTQVSDPPTQVPEPTIQASEPPTLTPEATATAALAFATEIPAEPASTVVPAVDSLVMPAEVPCTPGPGRDLTGCAFNGQSLAGVDFSGAILTNATFDGANLSGANFSGSVSAGGSTFDGALATGANFSNAVLASPTFNGATLIDAAFITASLSGATFDGSNMLGASFDGASGLAAATWGTTTTCPDGTNSGANTPTSSCLGNLELAGLTPTSTPSPSPTATTMSTSSPALTPSLNPCQPTPGFTLTVLSQGVDFGTLIWDGVNYSTSQQSLSVAIQGAVADCPDDVDDWTLLLSAEDMVDADENLIPASAIRYVGPLGDLPPGVSSVGISQPLGETGVSIATGDSSVETGSTWTIILELVPPSDLPPGEYVGTLVFDVVLSAG